jgi:hypothetical protein
VPPPPSPWVETFINLLAFTAPKWGLLESARVSAGGLYSAEGLICEAVSASRISVPGAIGDRFDDWGGEARLRYPLAPYGHFKPVRFCRLERDVPWVKACSLVREHHHCLTGSKPRRTALRSLTSLIHEGLAMIVGELLLYALSLSNAL